jgi:hypothetical protein
MYPLDLNVLCRKISAVSWEGSPRLMERGIIAVWRREWIFLFEGLKSCDDPYAINIRRKLCGHGSPDDAHMFMINKLYRSKGEQPWLIEWIRGQMPLCGNCGKPTDEIFIFGEEKNELCRPCYEGVVR